MGHAHNDTYCFLFKKTENVNVDETFDKKTVFAQVLKYSILFNNVFFFNIIMHFTIE